MRWNKLLALPLPFTKDLGLVENNRLHPVCSMGLVVYCIAGPLFHLMHELQQLDQARVRYKNEIAKQTCFALVLILKHTRSKDSQFWRVRYEALWNSALYPEANMLRSSEAKNPWDWPSHLCEPSASPKIT